MSLTKYLKYSSLGLVGFVTGAEILYHGSQKLRGRAEVRNEAEIHEIIFSGSSGDYKCELVRDIVFVCGPERFALEVLLNIILSAQKSIHLATHCFTSNLLAWALILAKNNGVDVKCVVDASMRSEPGAKVDLVRAKGIPVKFYSVKNMKLNFCVIDEPTENGTTTVNPLEPSVHIPSNGIVITGSLNFTRESMTANDETFVVTSRSNICQRSSNKFVEVWQNSRSDHLEFLLKNRI